MEQTVGRLSELDFLTKLQSILSEGLFSASYKYALLLALAELSVENEIARDGTLRKRRMTRVMKILFCIGRLSTFARRKYR